MVERTLSMREARGSMPRFSIINSTFGVVVTYFPSKEVPRFRLPEGALGTITQLNIITCIKIVTI